MKPKCRKRISSVLEARERGGVDQLHHARGRVGRAAREIVQDARALSPHRDIGDEAERLLLPIEGHEQPPVRIARLAHLADQQIQLVAALRRQPGPADVGEAPPQIRRAGAVAAQLDDGDAGVARPLDPVAQLHPLRPREREARQLQREAGAKRVDAKPAAPEQVHVSGAHLQRHHLLAVARGVAQEGVQQIGAAVLGRVHAAGHQPVPPLAPEGNEPLQLGDREAQVARRQREEAGRVIDVIGQRGPIVAHSDAQRRDHRAASTG